MTRSKLALWLARGAVTLAALGCGDDGASEDAGAFESEADAAMFVACPDTIPELEPGVAFTGEAGNIRVELMDASPMPARKFRNEWMVALTDGAGVPLDDAEVTRFEPFMRVHGHYSRPETELEPLAEPGQLHATVHFTMRGPWEVQVEVRSDTAGDDYVVLDVCVE